MPPALGNVKGLLGSHRVSGTATNWPGGGYDPRESHRLRARRQHARHPENAGAPPAGFSDIRYVTGIAGQPFREVLGPGDCCAADAPQTAARAREARAPETPAAPAPEGGIGLNVQGLPMIKPPYGLLAAINLDRGELMWQTPHGDTPGRRPQSTRLKGMTISQSRPGRARRASG